MFACTGKILRVNLTNRQVTTLKTEDYQEWIGGHGVGTAVFFDLVKDKTVGAFDPGNVLVIAPGLFSGTLVPASSRTEIVGIQAQSYPYEWFTRSNVGGRFASMLKYAGFDAIALEGAADKPTWINIVEGSVELRDAGNLWGLDTYATQKVIFKEVTGSAGFDNIISSKGGRYSTQRPAVLAIGPAGENKSRIAVIVTDAGNTFGQGGFGGVWGAKNLKAISVLGTGSIEVANPQALMEVRLWAEKNYGADFDNPKSYNWLSPITSHFGGHPSEMWTPFEKQRRASGCYGCHLNCKPRTSTGLGNEALCAAAVYYHRWERAKHGGVTEISGQAVNLVHQLGINAFELDGQLAYIKSLSDRGLLGPGKKIDTDLKIDKIGEAEFIEDLLHRIAYRKDIGDDLADGLPRAVKRWDLDEAIETGIIRSVCWGYPPHYDIRCEPYWGYSSIVAGRDINCHDINGISFWVPNLDMAAGRMPIVSAEEISRWIGEIGPYYDPEMLNFATDNIYSIHMARLTAWLLHYTRFWKQSCGLCDNAFADFINPYGTNNRGLTPKGETKFYLAVTGENLSFEDSIEVGRKIFNLDKAIWTLQGRHRYMEKFSEFVYTVDASGHSLIVGKPSSYFMPTKENGKWDYRNIIPRHLDSNRVEEWKDLFYELEGWDIKTGWQTRATLEDLKLNKVAYELEGMGKLP
jgi:aldehyde:ferredoxin oxidoreductase